MLTLAITGENFSIEYVTIVRNPNTASITSGGMIGATYRMRISTVKKANIKYRTENVSKMNFSVFKNGRSLVCEKAWRDGNTVFVIGKGKKYAVGYSESEIDLEKSFGIK